MLYDVRFLLMVTVASTLLGQVSFALIEDFGLRKTLQPILWMEIPPFLCGFVFPYLVIRLLYRSTLKDFGVVWFERGRRLLPWLVGGSVVVFATWVVVWAFIFAVAATVPIPEIGGPTELFDENPLRQWWTDPTPKRLVYVLHMFVFVGFAEELLGRGLIMNALERGYAGRFAVGRCTIRHSTVLAGFLFAAWHIDWLAGSPGAVVESIVVSLTVIAVPCLLLCVLYEKTRSMAAAIALHNVIDGGKLVVWELVGRLFVG